MAQQHEWLDDVGSNTYADQLAVGFRRLRFSAPLESEYLDFVRDDRFELQRTALIGAIVLWCAFAAVDQLLIHSQERWWMLAVRALVLVFLLVCAFLLVQRKYTQLLNPLSIACISALGLGASAVIAIAHRVDPHYPYEGLLLVCMAGYFLVGLRLSEAIISPLLMLSGYLLFELMVGISTPLLLNNLLFLLFGNLIGIVGCYLLEYKSREHFLISRLMRVLADHDSLTGLHNRRSFNRQLERLWRLAQREDVSLAMLICDIDHFKLYNDRYGHQGGDAVLQQVGQLLAGAGRRPLDMSVRLGGEEFAVLLYDISPGEAHQRAEQLRAALEHLRIAHAGSETAGVVTLSIGVACLQPAQGGALGQLYEQADKALYQAKSQGRNRVVS
ncbi:MAG: GGDEF domain-containing protein [Pseudomonas sp.]|uniref:GGDEF domain-containing protein n=1 Tax=Pseudomonas sp. TaxID=306 RepID=UPI00273243DF|nr:GGDEF domain-containing protein [Pseudomonas sp.]MDP3846129.1 GGDEF domain-containing protein [Pseudomonas sp.]